MLQFFRPKQITIIYKSLTITYFKQHRLLVSKKKNIDFKSSFVNANEEDVFILINCHTFLPKPYNDLGLFYLIVTFKFSKADDSTKRNISPCLAVGKY